MKRGLTMARFLLLAFASCTCLLGQSGAVLVGKLTGEGAAIAGASLQAVLLTAAVQKDGPAIWRTQSDASGDFRFGSLAPGSYRLCVTDAGNWLDPCQWPPENIIPVRGASGNPVEVKLRRGVRVAIAALDPEGHTKGRASEVTPPLAVSTIDSAGRARVVPFTASGPSSFLYTVVLPEGINADFRISSRLFAIGDDKGNRVDSQNYRVPVQANRLQRPVVANQRGIFRSVPDYDVVVPVHILAVSAP